MIVVEDAGSQKVLTSLPAYFGTKAAGDEIVGAGQDSLFIIDQSVELFPYEQAVNSESVSTTEPLRRQEWLAYGEIQRQLDPLRNMPEEDELGRIRPSDAAVSTAREITLRMLKSAVALPVPGDVSTDRDGGVRILWENVDRVLELICPFEQSQRPYMYYSDGHDYAIAYD